jgi:hypothetical protein
MIAIIDEPPKTIVKSGSNYSGIGQVYIPLRVIYCHDLAVRTISDELRGIFRIHGNSTQKSSRGVGGAIEHISDSITCLLSLNADPDDGSDVRVLDPELHNKRANVVHDDYGIVVLRNNGKDEVVSIIPSSEVVAS